MSKYDNSKFYWLQLKEDFFDEDAINWLEEQPNGKEYCLFYIKLCLKSLKTNAIMIRKVGQMLVPYDCEKLAELTKTKVDTVVIAMKLLTQIGLVKILKNGEIYLTKVEKMIGVKSIGAFKKEQQRLLGVDKCPPAVRLLSADCLPETRERDKTKDFSQSNINNIFIDNVRACETEEETEQTIKEQYKEYFSYWGYDEKDKQIFNEVIQVIVQAFYNSKTSEINFYKQKYDNDSFLNLISFLDVQDIRDIVWQVLCNEEINNRYLYILGALISRANEKIERAEKEKRINEETK